MNSKQTVIYVMLFMFFFTHIGEQVRDSDFMFYTYTLNMINILGKYLLTTNIIIIIITFESADFAIGAAALTIVLIVINPRIVL